MVCLTSYAEVGILLMLEPFTFTSFVPPSSLIKLPVLVVSVLCKFTYLGELNVSELTPFTPNIVINPQG